MIPFRQPSFASRQLPLSAILFALVVESIGLSQTAEDQGQGSALPPAESMSKFIVADGLEWKQVLTEPEITQPLMTSHDSFGRLWVVEYRQYPDPAGLKSLSQDNFRRTVYDATPLPPGHGGVAGADRISIHEDRDGDGQLESHTTFVDGLNIATAVVPTHNGAWVLNPPYLLFYSDADGDLHADGPPEVHLQGFGLEDTHSVVNSLCMGPDGWLYAAQGSTVSGAVKSFGSADKAWQSMGQAIWRYHPSARRYEIFAEGGGNAFGVAMNDAGEIFSGHNGGDTRGFHYYQGGYYRKGFSKHGSLSNPHTYGFLMPMRHEPIPRFTHTMLFTESSAMNDAMPRSMIAVDPLHGKLIQTELQPDGATYATRDVRAAVSCDDRWFRPVAINEGPDGAAYVCDWYDFQVAHIYAFEGKMDREHGRIYALTATQDKLTATQDKENAKQDEGPKRPSDPELLWNGEIANKNDVHSLDYLFDRLSHPFRWQRGQARRLIALHPLRESKRNAVLQVLFDTERVDTNRSELIALEFLWTAHGCGWLQDTMLCNSEHALDLGPLLRHVSPSVRSWSVRLACDDGQIAPALGQAIVELAQREQDPKVLCQIACSARRLPAADALTIVQSLLARELPVDEPVLVSMLWWAVEKHAEEVDAIAQTLTEPEAIWSNPVTRKTIAPNLIQRWCQAKSPATLTAAAQLLHRIHRLPAEVRAECAVPAQSAFEKAFAGRSLAGVPDALLQALMTLGQPSLTLRLRRGDAAAIDEAAKIICDRMQPESLRMQLARIAGETKGNSGGLLDSILEVALRTEDKATVRTAAIGALAASDQPRIGIAITNSWPTLPIELRNVAGAVLASRPSWTALWLSACESQQVDAGTMALEAVRAMRLHSDETMQKRIDTLYPESASISLASAQARSETMAAAVMREPGNPYRGKKHYRALCSRCHRLFDEGGYIGPDLTGYQRDQLQTLLRNVIAPSLEVREGYQMVKLRTNDGLVLSGFVESQNSETVVLKSIDGESRSLDRAEIEQMAPQFLSLMPEGLVDRLTDQELSDLMAYLRSSQPLNDG